MQGEPTVYKARKTSLADV